MLSLNEAYRRSLVGGIRPAHDDAKNWRRIGVCRGLRSRPFFEPAPPGVRTLSWSLVHSHDMALAYVVLRKWRQVSVAKARSRDLDGDRFQLL